MWGEAFEQLSVGERARLCDLVFGRRLTLEARLRILDDPTVDEHRHYRELVSDTAAAIVAERR